jgi:integrase
VTTGSTTKFLALLQARGALTPDEWDALDGVITAWAKRTTDASSRRWDDLLRDKQRGVYQFFKWVRKCPHQVTPADVAAWQEDLRQQRDPDTSRRHYSPATIYAMVSKVSSFYRWAQKNAKRNQQALANPVEAVRTKAPKAYQGQSTKALTDEELRALVAIVQAKAESSLERDYAMLRLYLVTGLRREEVAALTWGDVTLEADRLLLALRVKGGDRITREVRDPETYAALLDYLSASRRQRGLKKNSPLWTRHDRAGTPGPALTSHAFAKNMKRYAAEAGLEHFHLHQTRHTFARIVAEDSGSLIVTQDALGHANPQTTRIAGQRIGRSGSPRPRVPFPMRHGSRRFRRGQKEPDLAAWHEHRRVCVTRRAGREASLRAHGPGLGSRVGLALCTQTAQADQHASCNTAACRERSGCSAVVL